MRVRSQTRPSLLSRGRLNLKRRKAHHTKPHPQTAGRETRKKEIRELQENYV
jgi:hypothetical protein